MKKINLFLLIFLMALLVLPAQQVPPKKKKKYKARKMIVDKSYAYRDEMLLINKTDLRCLHFIKKGQSEDTYITGSEKMDFGQYDYTDADKMFINKGTKDGLQDGDIFMILGKGEKIRNPHTRKKLGYHYQRKALAKVFCLYESQAVVTIMEACHPVNIGDILIPHKEEGQMLDLKIDYRNCRIPQDAVEGNVILTPIYTDNYRYITASHEHMSIDLGEAEVAMGDWVLAYKMVAKKLPPVITGLGVVINVQRMSSTVKIIEATYPQFKGQRVIVLEKEHLPPEIVKKANGLSKNEAIPILSTLRKRDAAGTDAMDINILYDINEKSIKDSYKTELDKIAGFIKGKAEFVVVLRGYTCSIGGEEYNLKLSKQRVDNVQNYLMNTLNIDKKFFETYFLGEKTASFDNSTEKERRKNRRVHVEVRAK